MTYDALLVVSFGGPEGPDDVMPFLRNVTAGRTVPPERLAAVAEHYATFGGVSPINGHTRRLVAALEHHIELPIYWGNRNWHPFLADTLATMAGHGVHRALAFVTSGFSSYPSCHQYLDDIAAARAKVGPTAPQVDKLRVFFNHPRFIEAQADRLNPVLDPDARVLFSAHSIPLAMAATCDYEAQLHEAAALVAEQCGVSDWRVVYQSRSGPPTQPWLGPDVSDAIADSAPHNVVVVPIGFVCDHMEVVFDLDVVARKRAEAAGVAFARAGTVGDHPAFVAMIGELLHERTDRAPRRAVGRFGPRDDICGNDCCPQPQKP